MNKCTDLFKASDTFKSKFTLIQENTQLDYSTYKMSKTAENVTE